MVDRFHKAAGFLISPQDYKIITSISCEKKGERSVLDELERQYDTRRAQFSLKKSSRVMVRNPNVVNELTEE